MVCPHCGTRYESPQERWQQRQLALGNCVVCGKPKSEKDTSYQRCRACRLKAAERDQRRRARRTLRGSVLTTQKHKPQ